MFKKSRIWLAALFVVLSGCSQTPKPSNSASVESSLNSNSDSKVEKHQVHLPKNLSGVSLEISNSTPETNEMVRLLVRTLVPTSRRVENVKVNSIAIAGQVTHDENVVAYEFIMPAEDVSVEIDVVDVFNVKVADEVKDFIALAGISNAMAEGEVVSFRVVSYSGYWFKAVKVVEEDVILTEEAGVYSFTMPNHDINITAVTGANIYEVVVTESDYYRFNVAKKIYPVGETVSFTCVRLGFDTVIQKVFLDDTELIANENNEYSFVMPGHGVTLSATYEVVNRLVVAEDSEHFGLSLTVKDGENEVVAGNNVFANSVIYVEITEKESEEQHNYVNTGLSFKVGNIGDEDETLQDKVITLSTERDTNRQYFTMPTNYTYVKVQPKEEVSDFKHSSLVGSYNGYRPYYSGNQVFTLNDMSMAKLGVYGSEEKFVKLADKENVYETSDNKQLFTNGVDAVLYVDNNSTGSYINRGGTYLFKKTSATLQLTSNGKESYSYREGSSTTNITSQFYHVQFSDGSLLTCFYDVTKHEVVWNVQAVLLKGQDGQTRNDVVSIRKEDGTVLKNYLVKSPDTYGNGFQHQVESAPTDGNEGTYAGANGTLTLDGYGIAALNDTIGTYRVDNGVCVLQFAEVMYVVLNKEDNTYETTAAPTDGKEGTYTGDEGELVLDGYGNCTLNGVTGTYTLNGSEVTINVNDATKVYSLVGTEYMENSIFAGYTFKGSYYDRWDEGYQSIQIVFEKSGEIKGKLSIGYYNSYWWTFTATFDTTTNQLTMTVIDDYTTSKDYIGKVIVAELRNTNQLRFENDFGGNLYTFQAESVTCSDFPGLA